MFWVLKIFENFLLFISDSKSSLSLNHRNRHYNSSLLDNSLLHASISNYCNLKIARATFEPLPGDLMQWTLSKLKIKEWISRMVYERGGLRIKKDVHFLRRPLWIGLDGFLNITHVLGQENQS